MRAEANPCYILRAMRYRESSLLLEVLSRCRGRVALVARGAARRRVSAWPGLLMLFQPLLLEWRGRGELGVLVGAEEIRPPGVSQAVCHGRFFLCASYLNELLLRLLHRHDPYPCLFDAYEKALRELSCTAHRQAKAAGSEETLLRNFELILLRELGYQLLLEREAEGGPPVRPEENYHYELGAGPRLAQQDGGGLRISGSTLLALAQGKSVGVCGQREARELLRTHLAYYHGGPALHSHGIYRDYLRLLARHGVGATSANPA